MLPRTATNLLLGLLLTSAACRPDAPATEQAAPPAADSTTAPSAAAPASPASPAATAPAAASDTLRLPGGHVVQLRPTTAAAFTALKSDELPELNADSPDQNLAAIQGKVRRQGQQLLLQPARGPVVQLTSTPPTIEGGDAARYVYWGSLPAAHQWVVQAWYYESDGIVLVDQRTGRRLELAGRPAASPDGRYVLTTSPGLGGGDQVNSLSLVRIEPEGARLLWQREPASWAPEQARWVGPNRVLLQISRADAEGQLPDPPRPEYVELTLPTAP